MPTSQMEVSFQLPTNNNVIINAQTLYTHK